MSHSYERHGHTLSRIVTSIQREICYYTVLAAVFSVLCSFYFCVKFILSQLGKVRNCYYGCVFFVRVYTC